MTALMVSCSPVMSGESTMTALHLMNDGQRWSRDTQNAATEPSGLRRSRETLMWPGIGYFIQKRVFS